jgi:hypothetical protein
MLFGMSTCHTLKSVGNSIIGDELDKIMFDITESSLNDNNIRL